MKPARAIVSILLLATAAAQQRAEPRPNGIIYGVAIGQDGNPAKGIGLAASPLGVPLSGTLPHTRTNGAGEYRFENIPWGRYSVYAEDEDAGYSIFSNGPAGHSNPPEIELTPEHPAAELKVYLPPKAGFLDIHLTNRRTGADISVMRVAVMLMERPESPLFTMNCSSDHVVLVPPNKNLLLHLTSDGFREWDESVGRGKALHVPSGDRLKLDAQLEPSD